MFTTKENNKELLLKYNYLVCVFKKPFNACEPFMVNISKVQMTLQI